MQPKILTTNGGPHPASKWAELSAAEILSVDPNSQSENAQAGRRLEIKLLDILEAFHETVQKTERSHLEAEGDARLSVPLDHVEHDIDGTIAAIVAAAAGTSFAEHFARQDVIDRMRAVLAGHVTHNMHVERSWHADRSGSPAALAWHARNREVGRHQAHTFIVPGKRS